MAVSTVPKRALTSIPVVVTGDKITRWFALVLHRRPLRPRAAPSGGLSR